MAVVMALAAIAVAAVPASATTPPPDYGAGVDCRYHAGGPGPAYDWRIRTIEVHPPVMNASSGTQTVGWRYVVTRSKNWDDGPWKITYRSPMQKASATTAKAAKFTTRQVSVDIPDTEFVIESIQYRVTLKMYWYANDGSVQSQNTYLMPDYIYLENGHDYRDGDGADACLAGFYEGP